ncbi:MAG: UDP-2,3-diacylglucosamine diphosphatase [Thermodesulfobacteriota bacterium]
MNIIFIADAHLKGPDDPNQKTLARFLDGLKGVDTLVILGDLFDFWTGYNKFLYEKYQLVLDAMKSLRGRGTRIIYLEGNHDFTMGTFFVDTLGAGVYQDTHTLRVGETNILLAHGDMVDMTTGYRLWRGFIRSPLFRLILKIAPPWFVWRVAMHLSGKSRNYSVKGKFIDRRLRRFARERISSGADVVILGHSHVAGVHEEEVNGKKGVYANPGSWLDGSYLVYNDGEFRVERYNG